MKTGMNLLLWTDHVTEAQDVIVDQIKVLEMPIPLVGWKGQCVRLVPPDRSLHLENAMQWMNDLEITATLELNLGFSRKQEEAFFDRIETQNDTDFTWAILDQASRHIGFIGLHAINWRHRAGTGGILIGEPSAWGQGHATDAVRVRTRFALPSSDCTESTGTLSTRP